VALDQMKCILSREGEPTLTDAAIAVFKEIKADEEKHAEMLKDLKMK
jgi:hypothetical protein